MFSKCLLVLLCVVLIIAIYFPARHARHYEYVADKDILNELVITEELSNKNDLKSCSYKNLILNGSDVEFGEFYRSVRFEKPQTGGKYIPKTCLPFYQTAIIVPYRNRTRQLTIFLKYMHGYLQRQNLTYRIFIVEQNDNRAFNRAKMLNYGAKVAIELGMRCLILHDVDLLPVNTGNLYACSRKPRHMSSSIDVFRYNLPYLKLFGGVVAIQSEHFQQVNGMSNKFDGWGAEDDDFYKRLEVHNLLPYRFSPKISRYIMLNHKKEKGSPERFAKLENSVQRHGVDGLNSLENNVTVKLEDLYTLVLV